MKKSLTLILALILSACASQQENPYTKYAECTVPITRDAGMGVRVNGCAVWHLGGKFR